MLTGGSRDNIDLARDNFKSLYERKAQSLVILKKIVDYYQRQGLDLALPAHRKFINNLYYYNSQDLLTTGQQGGLSPHQKYCYKTMHPSLQASGNEADDEEAMRSFFDPYNQKKFTFTNQEKIPFVIPKNMPTHLLKEVSEDKLHQKVSETEITFSIKPLDLASCNDFNSMKKKFNSELDNLVKEIGIKIQKDKSAQAKKDKHNPDSIESFYKDFEGLAAYLLLRKDLTPASSEISSPDGSKPIINVDVNPSSFFDTAPGLLRNLEYVDDCDSIYRTAALINNKAKTKISDDEYGRKSAEELTLEGMATMSQFLKVEGAGPTLIITSLLSNLDNELRAENQAADLLNKFQQEQNIDAERILKQIFGEKYKNQPNYLLNQQKYDYFAEVVSANINSQQRKIKFKHINIGSNVQDAVSLTRTKDSYTSDRIYNVLKDDLGIQENQFNIKEADRLSSESTNPIDILKALAIREYLNDEAQEKDGVTPRYFYAGIINALIEKTNEVTGSIHCESGKDRTSVVAAIASKLKKMNAEQLKKIYENSQIRMEFFQNIQQELLEKNSPTQKVMQKTETGMQGIKVGTFSAVVGALLFKGFKIFGFKLTIPDPQVAIFIPRLLQPVVNLLSQAGIIGAIANLSKTKNISIKNLKQIASSILSSPKILVSKFNLYSEYKSDYYINNQKALLSNSFNNFNSIIQSYADKLKKSSRLAYLPIILLGITEIFAVQLPKFTGALTAYGLEVVAASTKVLAQKMDSSFGKYSPGFMLNAVGYALHSVGNLINNIFVHDFYNQIGAVTYAQEERFLYANLAAHSSAELRKKTSELLQEPASDKKNEKGVEPVKSFYGLEDFSKIPSVDNGSPLKISFNAQRDIPNICNYLNASGKSSWRIENSSIDISDINKEITAIKKALNINADVLDSTNNDERLKNIAMMHYAMLVEIKRCGDDKKAIESLQFNFHFKDAVIVERCQKIAKELIEKRVESINSTVSVSPPDVGSQKKLYSTPVIEAENNNSKKKNQTF